MSQNVAIVTGANKGIGFAIVKGLCQKFDGVVYLTSRDEERGKEAVAELEKLGLHPRYHQLNVSDRSSVKTFRDHIKNNHAGIDILINNAGIAISKLKNTYKDSVSVIDNNYRSILLIDELLFPLLKDNARVLNISSDCGYLSNIRNKEWIERLSKKDLSRADVEDFVNWYLESVKNGTFKREDFADMATIASYRVSKVAMSALTMIQQKELNPRGVCVNSMHPGLVSTDMTGNTGFYSADDAARTPIWLVLDAPVSIKGAYVWHDGKILDWYDHKANYYFKSSSIVKQYFKNCFGNHKFSIVSHLLVGVLSVAIVVACTYQNVFL